MSIKKQFLKSKPECKVTFRLSKQEIGKAEEVNLVGSFTQWEKKKISMNKLKSGEFSTVISLPANKSFEYRYLVDNAKWVNDSAADAYCKNEFGSENSVIHTVS